MAVKLLGAMILETLPNVQSLSADEKAILAQELLDELNAPAVSVDQEAAILDVLNRRFEDYRRNASEGSSWGDVRARLKEKTGASWRK